MPSVRIPCPKCHSDLKLPDRSYLGKKGKCPRCAHRFVLEEPDEEIELQLADSPAADPVAVGQAARWVPDAPAHSSAEPAPSPSGDFPDFAEASAAPAAGVNRLKELRRKNSQRRKTSVIVGAVMAVIGFVGYWGYSAWSVDEVATTDEKPTVNEDWKNETEALEAVTELADSISPTRGKPVSLNYMPSGSRIVIHMHLGALWSEDVRFQELRACLGPIAGWLEQQVEASCLYPPSQIETATFCWILGSRGSEPQLSTLVRMREPVKKSEWLQKSSGVRSDDFQIPVYFSDQRVFLLSEDQRTFANGPASLVTEMVDAANYPNPTASEIEEIVKETDSDRHVTVVFQPSDLSMHLEELIAGNVQPVMLGMLDWFGADVEATAWSLHFDKEMFSEIVMRNSAISTPARLQRTMSRQLDELPEEMYRLILRMTPDPTAVGRRKLIGRFPAMLNAVRHSTRAGIGKRFVQMTTVMNERAAPNLAIGTLLTWDESNRTDFSREVNVAAADPRKAQTIAQRLQIKLEVDFRRTPLQEAIAYISEETGVPFEINGDALKLSGYTKNLAQSVKLGMASGTDALKEILKKYDKMCIVFDEPNNRAILTTIPVAESEGLKPSLP